MEFLQEIRQTIWPNITKIISFKYLKVILKIWSEIRFFEKQDRGGLRGCLISYGNSNAKKVKNFIDAKKIFFRRRLKFYHKY